VNPIAQLLHRLRDVGARHYCPVCSRRARRFLPFGSPTRADAQCPHCGSIERHRALWRFLQKHTDLFDGRPKKMLHVAPEPCLEEHCRRLLGDGYLTADLLDPRAMEKMDVTDIRHPDDSFDVIYCSHVLEHVPDDRQAMREFCRVLRTGGWAVLLVPISAPETVEDPSITDPQERKRLFGQEDHVRRYGPDYADRLREAGFTVRICEPHDFLSAAEIKHLSLGRTGPIFYCTKPAAMSGETTPPASLPNESAGPH